MTKALIQYVFIIKIIDTPDNVRLFKAGMEQYCGAGTVKRMAQSEMMEGDNRIYRFTIETIDVPSEPQGEFAGKFVDDIRTALKNVGLASVVTWRALPSRGRKEITEIRR